MFVFKKPEPAIYHSEATDSDFKFRQSTDMENALLIEYIKVEDTYNNRKSLFVSSLVGKDDYYAAWLMEDFSGVQDENGKPHKIENFDLRTKAGLIQTLKQSDPEFSKWFASHCEAAEKKAAENAVAEQVVEPGSVQGVQGQ